MSKHKKKYCSQFDIPPTMLHQAVYLRYELKLHIARITKAICWYIRVLIDLVLCQEKVPVK